MRRLFSERGDKVIPNMGPEAMGGKFLIHRMNCIRSHDLKFEKFMLILFCINHSTNVMFI